MRIRSFHVAFQQAKNGRSFLRFRVSRMRGKNRANTVKSFYCWRVAFLIFEANAGTSQRG
jgi:hypothetical protein